MKTTFRVLFVIAILTLGTHAFAVNWTTTGDGTWSDSANWNGTVPNAAGETADFSGVTPTSAATVTLSSPATVGTLSFGSNATWSFAGSTTNLLTLDNNTSAANVVVGSGSTVTVSNLASTGAVNVSGGGTLQVTNGTGVQSWTVSNATLQDGLTTPGAGMLGSGTITLNDGATFKSAGGKRRNYSNTFVFSGNTTLFSQGIDLNANSQLQGTGTITVMGGWQMNMNAANPNLSANWIIKEDFLQTFKDGALGTGKVTINNSAWRRACGLLAAYDNSTFANDIEVQTGVDFLVGGGLGRTTTLTGKLTGSGTVYGCSNQYAATGTTKLQGDGSEFTGSWYIHQTYLRGTAKTLDKELTFVTNNTNTAKVNGGDSRFGTGTIHLGRGVLAAEASTAAFIHNNIAFDQDTSTYTEKAAFSVPTGSSLTLTGQLSGSYPVNVSGGGHLILNNTASNLTSAWNVTDTKITWDNNGSKSPSLGTGLLTVSNVTFGTKGSGDIRVANPIQLDGTVNLEVTRPLYLNGNLTGSGNIVWKSGGYTVGFTGDNRQYTGNISIAADYLNTNNTAPNATAGTDLRFGQGNLYFNTTGLSGDAGKDIYVANDTYVMSGKTGNFWKGIFHMEGVLTANGSIGTRTADTQIASVVIENKLQGNASLNLETTVAAGGTLAPGSVNVVNFDGTAAADQPIGTLTFSKGLTMEAGSALDIDFASTTSFDKVRLTGTSNDLSLDNVEVNLNFLDSFTGTLEFGDLFSFIEGANITSMEGLTLNYDPTQLPEEYQWARFLLTNNGGNLALMTVDSSYVPEPASWLILVLCLGMLRYRKTRYSCFGK